MVGKELTEFESRSVAKPNETLFELPDSTTASLGSGRGGWCLS
jgi:hypothetical protein